MRVLKNGVRGLLGGGHSLGSATLWGGEKPRLGLVWPLSQTSSEGSRIAASQLSPPRGLEPTLGCGDPISPSTDIMGRGVGPFWASRLRLWATHSTIYTPECWESLGLSPPVCTPAFWRFLTIYTPKCWEGCGLGQVRTRLQGPPGPLPTSRLLPQQLGL